MHESEESNIARFVSGFRRIIQDVVELYEYTSLKKLVHLTIKVESQVLKRINSIILSFIFTLIIFSI